MDDIIIELWLGGPGGGPKLVKNPPNLPQELQNDDRISCIMSLCARICLYWNVAAWWAVKVFHLVALDVKWVKLSLNCNQSINCFS